MINQTTPSEASERIRFFQRCRHRGLIPGPDEPAEIFLRRVELSPCLPTERLSITPFSVEPDWLMPLYSSGEVRLWEGAVTLIDQDSDGLHRVSIHVGKSLLLPTSSLLAHEWVHAIRCAFPDSYGEEILAWRTCPARWARGLALLALDWRQLSIFAGAVIGIWLGLLFEDGWLLSGGAMLACGALLRGWMIHRPYTLAAQALSLQGLPTWPILLHLSQAEICALSRAPSTFWEEFAEANDFRFEFLHASFAMLRSS
jgi:hypothetical protein